MKAYRANQRTLFKVLADYLPIDKTNLANWLAELLSIDISNAYRRIRGEIDLSLPELALLTREFPQLPLILERIWIKNRRLSADLYDMRDWSTVQIYLRRLNEVISRTAEAGGMMYYNCRELSFFLTISEPVLMRKNLVGLGARYNLENSGHPPAPVIKLCKQLLEIYYATDSIEVWHPQGWTSFIERMRSRFILYEISPKEQKKTAQALKTSLIAFRGMVSSQLKPGGGKLIVLIAEYSELNEAFVFKGQMQCHLGSPADTAIIITDDKPSLEIINHQWKNQVAASRDISGASTLHKQEFFLELLNNINALKKGLQKQ